MSTSEHPSPLRALIADDEPLARQRLEDLLRAENGVEIAGAAENGAEAVDAIRRLRPDLVFLDVQMPGLSGIEVVEEIGPERMPATIFVTAYDEHAVRAFDLAALDYLLKPFDDERFEQALVRAKETVALRAVGDLRRRLSALLDGEDAPPSEPPAPRPLERVAVETRGQVRVVPVKKIAFITASGSYAELHTEGGDTHVIRERMQTLEERLDPERFFRIHRSSIVQLDRVEALLVNAGGDYAVRLKNGRRLKVSRSRREALEERLGLDALR